MPKLILIDDHRMLSETVALAVTHRGLAEVEVLDPYDEDTMERLEQAAPDACLIDLELGTDELGGIRFLGKAIESGFRAAMFTGCLDDVKLGRCIEAGALGIINKGLSFEVVVELIERLLAGEPVSSDTDKLAWVLALQEHRRSRSRDLAPFEQLTAREQTVLRHMMNGHKVEHIAELDFVSVTTVRTHVRSVLQKLGVNSQIAAVAEAHRSGWANETR